MVSKLSLTLNEKDSKLNGIRCKELVDIEILDKLINSDLLITSTYDDGFFYDELNLLRKYKILVNKKKGFIEVQYNKKKNMKYGRVNPLNNMGLFGFRRSIRQTLSKNKFVDIDIVNAHPIILKQICDSNEIDCEYLTKYVENRDKYLEMIQKSYLDKMTDKIEKKNKSKNLFIRLLYFGKVESWLKDNNLKYIDDKKHYDANKFIKKFSEELDDIGEKIIESNKELKNKVKKIKKKEFNIKGSTVSYFLQEYEVRILETIYDYCVNNKYIINNVCVLCADGIMIEKDKYSDNLLIDLQKEIKKKIGFDLKLIKKEMTEDYLDSIDEHIRTDIDISDTYDIKKSKFEINKFKIMNPISFCEVNENNIIIRSKQQFCTAYENIRYDKEKIVKEKVVVENIQFVEEWMKDSSIRTYSKIDFLPMQKEDPDVYNSFRGYRINSIKKDKSRKKIDIKTTKVYKHLQNLCGNVEKIVSYVEKFLARKIQKPYKLTNTALLFRSLPGVGKDMFFDWFANSIMGRQYYTNSSNADLFFGNFSDQLHNKIIIVVNEVEGSYMFEKNPKLKDYITNKKNLINPKGQTSYEETNNIGYIFLTNTKNPIKIEADDRRITAIDCNSEIANNNEYFTALLKEMNDDQIALTFYEYLMSIQCDDYDFTSERPITSFYQDMRESNIPLLVKFFEKEIISNVYRDSKTKEIKIRESETITSSGLFKKFITYIEKNKHKYEISSTRFGTELKSYKSIIRTRSNMGIKYTIYYEKLKDELVKAKYIEWDDDIEIEDDYEDDSENENKILFK